MSDPGEKQFQVVVDFGRGADRRTRITRIDLLFDRNGRGYAGDEIDLGLVDLAEELPGIGRQAFDITPLPLREDGVEGERRFTRTGKAGNCLLYTSALSKLSRVRVDGSKKSDAITLPASTCWCGSASKLSLIHI